MLTLEPLADEDDRWLMALTRLSEKIRNPNLALVKYLQRNGFGPLNIYDHRSSADLGDAVYDPPPDLCPAVVIFTTPTAPVEDQGAGSERWTFSVGVNFKIVVRDGDQGKALRAFHELIRTIFAGWRPGTLDPLSTIPGVGYYLPSGDLSPILMTERTGGYVGRASLILRFDVNERILG